MRAFIIAQQDKSLNLIRSKINGIVPNSKVQMATFRSLIKLEGDTKTLSFNFKDGDNDNRNELASLLKENNIACVYALGIGICRVPKVTGKEYFGNAKMISYPHSSIFAAKASGANWGEIDSIQGFFNSKMKFETDQTTRLDTILASDFMSLEQYTNEIVYGIQHMPLPTVLPLVGGKDNRISLTMSPNTDISQISGGTGFQNYGVVELLAFQIITDGTATKESVLNSLK